MRPDIFELERFYRSKLGTSARRLINVELRRIWEDVKGERLLGVGFATPFLRLFAEAERTLAMMPATQGVWPWPPESPGRTCLAREDEVPFADSSFDRVLLAHALECSPHPNRLMRECWRILADGGRLLVIVPNRRGLWCWSDRTPFGTGQPFNRSQLERTLRSHLFQPINERSALFVPPSILALTRQLAIPVERVGVRYLSGLAGVHLIEAEKQVHAATPALSALRPSSRRYLPVPEPALSEVARKRAR